LSHQNLSHQNIFVGVTMVWSVTQLETRPHLEGDITMVWSVTQLETRPHLEGDTAGMFIFGTTNVMSRHCTRSPKSSENVHLQFCSLTSHDSIDCQPDTGTLPGSVSQLQATRSADDLCPRIVESATGSAELRLAITSCSNASIRAGRNNMTIVETLVEAR